MRAGQQGSPGVFFHRPVSTTVWITTSNLHSLAREESALATTLLPEHPVPGAPRSTIGHRKFSCSCVDSSSWVCSGCSGG